MFVSILQTGAKLAFIFYGIYKVLDIITLQIENCRRKKSEEETWELTEKNIYSESKLIEIRNGRCLRTLQLRSSTRGTSKGIVFLVHGSMARLSQFENQIYYFQKHGYDILAYDYYGMGRSPKTSTNPNDYSTKEHTKDLIQMYKHFFLNSTDNITYDLVGKPLHIVGHSFGCSQVLRLIHYILSESEGMQTNLRSVILLGSGLPSTTKMTQMRRVFSLPLFVLRLMHPLLSAGFKERALHPLTVKGKETGNEEHIKLLKFSEATSGANPMHVVKPFYTQMKQIDELTARSVAKMCKESNINILMATGEVDQLTTVESCQELARTWLAQAKPEVTIIPFASHQCMQEKPEVVNDLIMEFIEGA